MRTRLAVYALSVAISSAAFGQDAATTLAYLKEATGAFVCQDESATFLFLDSGHGEVTLRYRTRSGLTINHLRLELERLGPASVVLHELGFAVTVASGGEQGIEAGLSTGGWQRVEEGAAVCFAEEDGAKSYARALNHLIRLYGGDVPPF